MSAELKGQVNSFLKRAFKCGFCRKIYTIEAIADDADIDLFRKMANPCHCIHSLLLLLNLVTITSDPKDIHMNCPDVTLRSIRSHLSHVASLNTYNVFYPFLCSFLPLYVYTLFRFHCDMYVCYVLY